VIRLKRVNVETSCGCGTYLSDDDSSSGVKRESIFTFRHSLLTCQTSCLFIRICTTPSRFDVVGFASGMMPRRTGDAAIYTFGLEEEFFLAHARTRAVVTRVPKSVVNESRALLGTDRVSHEMLQSQIEIVSPVFQDVREAFQEMARLRNGVHAIAAQHGLIVLASGTAPLSAWRLQQATDKPRYAQLLDDYQMIGQRNLLCGLHVHVAPPSGVDRVQLMNRLMPWLPLFLALSTSSPFWNRQQTGLLSYRQAAYDEWPRTGIPDFFDDEAAYSSFVDLLVKSGSMSDAGSLWWALRPSHHLPTLELRIADSCTYLEDAIALASLFRCLVRAHVRRADLGRGHSAMSRRVIDENRWRAKRYGIDAEFIDEATARNVPVRQLIVDAQALLAEDAAALGCEAQLAHFGIIFSRGTSARQQIQIYAKARAAGGGHRQALMHVVDWISHASIPRCDAADSVTTA
jgi:carboxylate-amine ligase